TSTRVSDYGVGAPLGQDPFELALDRDGTLLVADQAFFYPSCAPSGAFGGLLRYDPAAGTRTLVTPVPLDIRDVRVGVDGKILITCPIGPSLTWSVCSVDPTT